MTTKNNGTEHPAENAEKPGADLPAESAEKTAVDLPTGNAEPENAEPGSAKPENAGAENAEPENAGAENVEPENAEPGSAKPENAQNGGAEALWASLAAEIPAPVVENAEETGREAEGESPETLGFAPEGDEPGAMPGLAQEGEAAKPDAGEKTAKAKESGPKAPVSGPFGGKSLGPVIPSVPMMKDEDGNLVPTPHTVTSRIFSGLAHLSILLPLALLLAQVAFTLDARSLWYSDEVRYASAYREMGMAGDWLVLHLNGAIYPDKPPMFFWMLHGLKELSVHAAPMLPFPITENMIFFAGMALSGILCLFAAHLLASVVARVDKRTVLAANLILVGSFFFAGLLHYLRMDLLFTALITFSHVVLFHALIRRTAPLLMPLGFLLAGAAVLVKGPLGFAFPLLAGVFFLLWQGRITRIFRLDFIFGLIIGLAAPAAWLGLAWMNAGDVFLDNILNKQILARALNTWHHAEPWYHYLVTFPLIWLPWTLLFFFLPWGRFMGKRMREGLKTSRTAEGAGIAYLWCAVIPGFVLLSLVSIKIPIYCLPLFPPLAVLSARAILRMRPFATACLQWTFAALLALLGVCFLLAPMIPKSMMPIPYLPAGTMLLGGVCLVFACMLAFLAKPRRGEGAVLFMALFTTAFAYPLWSVTAPSLDAFLSPRSQAEIIKAYKAEGYSAVTYKVYPGTYTYYAGNVVDSQSFEEALALAEKNPKTIMALRASFWDNLENKPAGFTEVNRRKIAERAYVLVARPALGKAEDEAPATPEAPAGQEAPATPETPASPAAPLAPETPAAPEIPAPPAAPAIPEAPATPEAPVSPTPPAVREITAVPAEVPAAQEAPETPAAPGLPAAPTAPEAPAVQASPAAPAQ